jgi:hypothetical protein
VTILLTGDDAARAWAAIDDVAAQLAALPREAFVGEPTLAGGAAGTALFFAYLAGAQEDRGHEEHAGRFLEWAQEEVAEGRIPFGAGLYQGFTGVAWVVEHVTGDAQDAIDEHMATYLRRSPWAEDYDLISGLAGFAIWALEALPRPGAAECLRLVCERLVEYATPPPDGKGRTWWTPPRLLPSHQREVFPDGYENFGLAHGFPAVIGVLAQAVASGALDEPLAARCLAAAHDGFARLMAVVRPAGGSRYPTTIDARRYLDDSRLGWCYGDPGVGAALTVASQVLDEPGWRAEAEAIALACARRDVATAGVVDPGICHGSAGLVLMFRRFHERFGHPELLEAARHWARVTLDFRRAPTEFFSGWSAYSPDGYRAAREWLTGATGVAMTLLTALTGTSPEWDRTLLLSPCPAALRTR